MSRPAFVQPVGLDVPSERGTDSFLVLFKGGRLPSWHQLTDAERTAAENEIVGQGKRRFLGPSRLLIPHQVAKAQPVVFVQSFSAEQPLDERRGDFVTDTEVPRYLDRSVRLRHA